MSHPLSPRRRALTALCVAAFSVAAGAQVPGSAGASARVYCNMFHSSYAIGTTCATADKVSNAYAHRCAGQISATAPINCRVTVLGYRCHDTGDAYHPVHCARGYRRVTFQLAE